MPFSVQSVTVAVSAKVSGTFTIPHATFNYALSAPTITSGQVYLLGAFSDTSADFVRLYKTDGSTTWVWNAGPGSAAVTLQDVSRPFPYGRIETQNFQAAARVFTIVTKT